MRNYIFNHTSFETALEIKDYPYGFRLRTSIFYWIESEPKKGDRFCSCTINPKNGRINAPKKSTFSNIGVMFSDEKGHIHWDNVSIYTKQTELEKFIQAVGEYNLNDLQKIQLKQLRGKGIPTNRALVKDLDYKVKWEKAYDGESYSELKITFDRPDGVKVKEIFEAIRSVNQEKLVKMFEGWQSKHYGVVPGFVRICVRGGAQITSVGYSAYKEYLASDHVATTEDMKAKIVIN